MRKTLPFGSLNRIREATQADYSRRHFHVALKVNLQVTTNASIDIKTWRKLTVYAANLFGEREKEEPYSRAVYYVRGVDRFQRRFFLSLGQFAVC